MTMPNFMIGTDDSSGASPSMDRLFIASEVTRRLNYIRRDTCELMRLLQGATLSEDLHESLCLAIEDLQRIADATRPK